jgi:hypothetical protein
MYDENGNGCPNCNTKSSETENSENVTKKNVSQLSEGTESNDENIIDEAKNIFSEKVVPFMKNSVLPFVKQNKKVLIIVLSVLIAVLIIVGVTSSIIKNSPLKVNASSFAAKEVFTQDEIDAYFEENEYYGSYYDEDYANHPYGAGLVVKGYEGAAYIEPSDLYNVFVWESLTQDVNKELAKRQKENRWSLSFYDLFTAEDAIHITLSAESAKKNGQFKNGDKVEIEYTFTPDANRENMKFEPSSGKVSFKIEGLQEVDLFDPFNYVNFAQSGANSAGVAKLFVSEGLNESLPDLDGFSVSYYDDETIALEQNGYIIGKIRFYFENNNEEYCSEFSNGDDVTMYCSSIENLTEDYGIYISRLSNVYKFDSLGEYITKDSTISQTDINAFKAYADKYLNERFGSNSSYSNITFNSSYIVDCKDLTVYNSLHNGLCLVYSYTYTGWLSTEGITQYMYVSFENLIADKDGNITETPEENFDRSDYGYDSTDALLERLYGSNYNVVKTQ